MNLEQNISFKYIFPKNFIFTILFHLVGFTFLIYKFIYIEIISNPNSIYEFNFYFILTLILFFYFFNFNYDFYPSININVFNKTIMEITNFKLIKIVNYKINLKEYDYKLVQIHSKLSSELFIILSEKAGKNKLIVNCNANMNDIMQIYNYLLENFPENNKGKRWRFLFFGNDWYYILKPYILKYFSKN